MSSNQTDQLSQFLREFSAEDDDDDDDEAGSQDRAGNVQGSLSSHCQGNDEGEAVGSWRGEASQVTYTTDNLSSVNSSHISGSNCGQSSSQSDLFSSVKSAGEFYHLKVTVPGPTRSGVGFGGVGSRLARLDPLSSARQFARLMLPCAEMPVAAALIVAALPSGELPTDATWSGCRASSLTPRMLGDAVRESGEDSGEESGCSDSDLAEIYATPPETLTSSAGSPAPTPAPVPAPASPKRRRVDPPESGGGGGVVGEVPCGDPDECRALRRVWYRRLAEHPMLGGAGAAAAATVARRQLPDALRARILSDLLVGGD